MFTDFLDHIESKHEKNVTIYIGIGSAAHRIELHNNTEYKIDPRYDQEFPCFMRDLKEKYLEDPVYIFLIDPMLEEPPFIVCNGAKQFNNSNWEIVNDMEYYNENTNIHVFPLRFYVSYINEIYKHGESMDIMPFFDELNKKSIENNWLTIIQDYTGRNISYIGEYYDKSLENHRNHIIYGIGVRKDGGCDIDLTDPLCKFVYDKNDEDTGIKVFNPYDYDEDNRKLFELSEKLIYLHSEGKISDNDMSIIEIQKNAYFVNKKKFISNSLLGLLRLIKLNLDGKEFQLELFNCSSYIAEKKYNIDLKIDKKVYSELFIKVMDIFKDEMISYLKYVKENYIEIVNDTLNNILKIDDCYKWAEIVEKNLNY